MCAIPFNNFAEQYFSDTHTHTHSCKSRRKCHQTDIKSRRWLMHASLCFWLRISLLCHVIILYIPFLLSLTWLTCLEINPQVERCIALSLSELLFCRRESRWLTLQEQQLNWLYPPLGINMGWVTVSTIIFQLLRP